MPMSNPTSGAIQSWQGNWSSVVSYQTGALVRYTDPSETDPSVYLAVGSSLNVVPGTNTAKWELFSVSGTDSTVAGPAGANTPVPLTFVQTGTATVGASDPWYPPFAVAFEHTVLVDAVEATPTSGDVVCDVRVNGTTIFATDSDRPKILSGATTGTNSVAALATTGATALTPITFNIISTGAAATTPGEPTPAAPGTFATTTGTVTTANVPIPASYSAGDLLVCAVVSGSPVASLPTGWSRLGSTAQDAAPSLYLDILYKTAVASESASQSMSFTAGTPACIATLPIHDAATSSPFALNPSATVVDAAATTGSTPSGTTTIGHELGLFVYADRFTGGATSNLATDAAITERCDIVTTRTAATNVGLTIATKAYVATGAVSAYTATAGASVRWVNKMLTVKQAASSGVPGSGIRGTIHYTKAS